MAIAAIVAFLFGLSFILMPVQTMAMYGVTLDISGQFLGRYLGSAFLGVAVLTWFARNAKDDGALRAILLGNTLLAVTGFVVALLDVFTGVGNTLVWSTVVIYLLLTAGFGYFYFEK
jgi:hypothetical protein